MNHFFRGSEVAAQLSRQFVGDRPPDTEIEGLLPETKEVKEICKRYAPWDKKANPKEPCPVLISDFLEDLHRIRPIVLEATITFHLSGFESFLRSWLWHATHPNLLHLHGSTSKQVKLHKVHSNLSGVVKQPISLWDITQRFGEVDRRLRQEQPFFKIPQGFPHRNISDENLNAFTFAQMWREVRNLIVHHEGTVHKDFLTAQGTVWELSNWYKRPKYRKCVAGQKLRLSERNVIHCFTVCDRAARILNDALNEMRQFV